MVGHKILKVVIYSLFLRQTCCYFYVHGYRCRVPYNLNYVGFVFVSFLFILPFFLLFYMITIHCPFPPFPLEYFSFSVFREIAQVQEESGQMAIRLGRENFCLTSRFSVFKPIIMDPELFIRISTGSKNK
jgi:hypothetical protein